MGKEFSVQTQSAGVLQGLRWGEPELPAVLALHGWLDNAASFAPLAPLLPGLQIIALDLPGHGKSDHRSPGGRYHLLDYLPAVLEAAGELGLNELILMGHSLGGAIAGLIAASLPERVKALVLLEAIGPLSEPEDKAPGRLRDSLLAFAASGAKAPASYPDLQALVDVRARVGKMSDSSARLLIERNVVESAEGYRWRSDSRLRLPSPMYFSEVQVLEYLKAISVPTQILLGSDGLPAEREHLKARLEVVPQAEVEWFEGAHHVHMDSPEPLARSVLRFLTRLGLAV